MRMPRGMGRYGMPVMPRLAGPSLHYILDVLLLALIIALLIHLFVIAPIYVIALVLLMALLWLHRMYPWAGRMW